MPSRTIRRSAILALCLVPACFPSGPPAGPPPSVMAADEPVAFLLERRDSLRLSEDVANQLVRLNARLFRRNQPLRFSVDTMLSRAGRPPYSEQRRRSQPLPAELQERLDPLLAELLANANAVRDTAYAMLTPEQRTKAEELAERARTMGARRTER